MIFEIEIVNWDKYNPKSDHKKKTWFRLNSDLFADDKIQLLSATDFKVWIWLMCERVRVNTSCFRVAPKLMSSWVRVKPVMTTSSIRHLHELSLISIRSEYELSTRSNHGQASPKGFKRKSSLNKRLRTYDTNNTNNTIQNTEISSEDLISKPEAPPKEADQKEDKAWPTPRGLVELWNSLCGDLPKAARLTTARAEQCRVRLGETPDRSFWETAISKLAASDFAKGNNTGVKGGKPWTATFDWLIKNETNAVKAFEGNYDNKHQSQSHELREMTYEEKLACGMIMPDDSQDEASL